MREVNQGLSDGAERVRSPRWQLVEAYGYVAKDRRYFVVPAHSGVVREPGQSTDLASVPGFLWGILGPFGQHLRSALLHDHRCEVANGTVGAPGDDRDAHGQPFPDRTPVQIRAEADDLFREALEEEGVGLVRRWIFWTGVAYGGLFMAPRAAPGRSRPFLTPRRVLGGVLTLLVLAAAVVSLHALTVALGGGPPRADGWLWDREFWLTVLGVAALMAVLRRGWLIVTVPVSLIIIAVCLARAGPDAPWVLRSLSWHAVAVGALLLAAVVVGLFTDVRMALIAMVLAPLILPVVLLTTLAQVTLALPDLISWAVRGYRDDEPVVGPTLGPPK